MAEDFTYRNDEWEIDGVLLCADLEIAFNWTWSGGEPGGFTPWNVIMFCGERPAPTPRYINEAMKAWTALNQATLVQRFHDSKLYRDAAE